MKKLLLPLLATQLVACSTFESWTWADAEANEEQQVAMTEQQANKNGQANMQGQQQNNMNTISQPLKPRLSSASVAAPNEASVEFQNEYRDQLLGRMTELRDKQPNTTRSVKNLNYYVRTMMQDLVGNMKYVNAATPVVVTSFVMLDSDFQHADLLGRQISESFIHEVHKYGIPVLDFKTLDFIRVTPQGDFVFSKDYLELNGDLPIKYAVAGTMVKQVSGYLVNARVIGIESKAVVASAQGFLPANVVNSLISSGFSDGVPLMSGE